MSENKKITLHPLRQDGSIDIDTNLYPKTSINQIVDDGGEPVAVATKGEIPTEVSDLNNDVGYITADYLKDYATKTELSEKANDNENKVVETEQNSLQNIEDKNTVENMDSEYVSSVKISNLFLNDKDSWKTNS